MKTKKTRMKTPLLLAFMAFAFCNSKAPVNNEKSSPPSEPHRYGGWYCPDNLNGFNPVNLADWEQVPVINHRFPTEEEVKTEQSLIFVDQEKYPTAQVLPTEFPKLASYFNRSSNKYELVILIQGFTIDLDTIVGFRYLNGGNGSARLNEVEVLKEETIAKFPKSEFVTLDVEILASKDTVWKVLTHPDLEDKVKADLANKSWYKSPRINYWNEKEVRNTASFANLHFGNFYAQIDFETHTEKILLLQEQGKTKMKVVMGPFLTDLDSKKKAIQAWTERVKKIAQDMEC